MFDQSKFAVYIMPPESPDAHVNTLHDNRCGKLRMMIFLGNDICD